MKFIDSKNTLEHVKYAIDCGSCKELLVCSDMKESLKNLIEEAKKTGSTVYYYGPNVILTGVAANLRFPNFHDY